VVALAVGAARGDLVRRTAIVGSGGGRVVGRHVEFEMDMLRVAVMWF
jgi:hypothetical protein